MSGEYFTVEDDTTKLFKDYVGEKSQMPSKHSNKKTTGTESNEKLQDIEVQLEIAETRCNTLKGQLDYMKNLYGSSNKTHSTQKIRKYSNAVSRKRDSNGGSAVSVDTVQSINAEYRSESARQSSNLMLTENSGGNTKAIHSIINGITNSVNRLSDLHIQIVDTPKPKRLSQESTHVTNVEIKPAKSKQIEDLDLPPLYQELDDFNTKFDPLHKASKRIVRNIKKNPVSIPFDSRIKKISSSFMSSAKANELKRNSSSVIHKRRQKHLRQHPSIGHNLVEIYHNTAAKESDSDHSAQGKCKGRSKTSRSCVEHIQDIPPLTLNVPDDESRWRKLEAPKIKPTVYNNISNIKNVCNVYTEQNEPLNDLRESVSRSYQLPTIASKMKQVAKCYFNAFNFKAIPFCPATSTSPSHNIGINLQQVMNMMKTKQPFHGLSPTLAHNIGLAAERLNSRPASMMVTSLTTRTATCSFVRSNSCPLSKSRMNYHQLQEIAKGIPEEDIIMERDEEIKDSPIRTSIITGPSGDMEVRNRNDPVWAADPDSSQKCTCVNMSGADLQQLVNKYHLNQPPNSIRTELTHHRIPKSKSNLTRKNNRPVRMSLVTKNNGIVKNYNNNNVIADEHLQLPMHGKEKTLKGVLTNLHKEFDAMNKRYEELSKMGEDMNEDNLKELETLDKDLSTKEEEITMVMDLYKEVLALKHQVQTLKQKSSQASISQIPKFTDYHNPKAAFHLTKLLKQIQLYQLHYKKDQPSY